MKCEICGSNFYTKKRLSNFFKIKEYSICQKCFDKYKIDIEYNVIPVGNNKMIIVSLFSKLYYFKNDPFLHEFSKLFVHFYKNRNCDNLFVYNNFFLNEETINTFENISNLLCEDVYIICNCFSV